MFGSDDKSDVFDPDVCEAGQQVVKERSALPVPGGHRDQALETRRSRALLFRREDRTVSRGFLAHAPSQTARENDGSSVGPQLRHETKQRDATDDDEHRGHDRREGVAEQYVSHPEQGGKHEHAAGEPADEREIQIVR